MSNDRFSIYAAKLASIYSNPSVVKEMETILQSATNSTSRSCKKTRRARRKCISQQSTLRSFTNCHLVHKIYQSFLLL